MERVSWQRRTAHLALLLLAVEGSRSKARRDLTQAKKEAEKANEKNLKSEDPQGKVVQEFKKGPGLLW